MPRDKPTEKKLLKTILEPLLADFQYWFDRSHSLLSDEEISFLVPVEQEALLKRVKQSQQEVSTAQMLFKATDGEAGVDLAVVLKWHQVVAQCWQVTVKWRQEQNKPEV